MIKTQGYAAYSATTPLSPFDFERRDPGPHDVQIQILFCGVCHSDLHTVRSEWEGTVYPMVPGHEIVGRVTAVGAGVSAFKAGDLAAVGCLVDSCQHCASCAGNTASSSTWRRSARKDAPTPDQSYNCGGNVTT
jgi:uncharacterized zinc-type alcohol dehydrogenase-like protein